MAKKDLAWKATSALTLLVSGMVAQKVVSIGWSMATGKPAPKNEEELLNYRLGEVAAFAIISGAIMTLTHDMALRQLATWYGGPDINPLTGEAMPGIEA